MNLYNVMINYKGEGSTNIYIPGLGDTNIVYGRPIYLKNASFNVIEALRQFRVMKIDIQINAKQDGAFRIIDLEVNKTPYAKLKETHQLVKEEVTESDIASVFKAGTSGPIPTPEKPKTTDFGSYVLPSGSYEGKTLAEVDKMGKLKAVYNGYKNRNKEIKEAIEKYYGSQVNK